MIFVLNGKFKKDKSESSADLITRYNLKYLENPEKLDKEVRKGNHVYCWIAPKHDESDENYMYWNFLPEEAKNDFFQAMEKI